MADSGEKGTEYLRKTAGLPPEVLAETGYTLTHESGHYLYGLHDEYKHFAWDLFDTGRHIHFDALGLPSLMGVQEDITTDPGNLGYVNFSTKKHYIDQGYPETRQWVSRGMSAWEYITKLLPAKAGRLNSDCTAPPG
jgi:hypothetical protein